MDYKYKICVVSMFKNESMIIDEWIQHYISEGIQHFYLIDNGSNDNYLEILNKYIEKITLVIDDSNATQNVLFNKHFLDLSKKESEWIIICDIDEYIYSRNEYKTTLDYINNIPKNIEKIILPWKNFGNNNIVNQPKCIVSSFTMCEDTDGYKERVSDQNWTGHCKCLFKTKNLFGLEIHCSKLSLNNSLYFSDFSEVSNNKLYDLKSQNLHINHYQHMSLEYYTNVKMIRGGGQTKKMCHYNLDRFNNENKIFNAVSDCELYNKKYLQN
jgi:hypothetical protein